MASYSDPEKIKATPSGVATHRLETTALGCTKICVRCTTTIGFTRVHHKQGGSRVGGWGNRPPKTYESNFIYHAFSQCRNQQSRYKAILSSIVLLQQCC